MICLQYAGTYCLLGFVTIFLVSIRDTLMGKSRVERVPLEEVFCLWPGFVVAIICQIFNLILTK